MKSEIFKYDETQRFNYVEFPLTLVKDDKFKNLINGHTYLSKIDNNDMLSELYDLTLMFGKDKEPKSVKEFESYIG